MRKFNLILIFFCSLISLIFYGCQTHTTILNNLPERDANEILVLLNSKGIKADKTPTVTTAVGGGTREQMWDIVVPPQEMTQALAILNKSGLPRIRGTSLLDLFGTQGIVPSDLQDRIRYQEGLSEQLGNTIRKMDGIMDADVQIILPREDEQRPVTASVFIQHRGIVDTPNSLVVNKIKRLISSAIPGMTPENVSVVTDRARYTDLSLFQANQQQPPGHLVSIWSVLISPESVWLFRAIFYSFIILLFIALSMIAWLVWKFFPYLSQLGARGLFRPEQIHPAPIAPVNEEIGPIEEGLEEQERL